MRGVLLLLVLGACGRTQFDARPDGSSPLDASGAAVDGACGQTLAVSLAPPDVMIVLDRSCSMTKLLSGTTTTKWAAAVAAIESAVAASDVVRWGLTLFPDTSGDACTQDAIPVPITDGNAPVITTMLTAALDSTNPLFPGNPCVTNLDTGVEQAATDPGLADPAHPGYMVLVTDGAQAGCDAGGSDAGAEGSIQAMHDQHGVATFVIGFGSHVDTDELDTLATLGGAPLPGPHGFYQADDGDALNQALASITHGVVSCSYTVDPAPADLSQTYVWFDKTQEVPRDPSHAAGWDFDPATERLTLYGSYCDSLENQSVTDIDVIFGCPAPPLL